MSSTATRSRAGSAQPVVPVPPSQPQRPGAWKGSGPPVPTPTWSPHETPAGRKSPADVRWAVVGLQEPVRLELEGAGPMGIGLRAEYGIEQRGKGSTVSGRMEFKGPAVMMVGPQLETEVGNSLRASLGKLKSRVEA